ncbi:MAG: polymerase sigma factor SigM [Acidimicrobiales bacterium]|nr:polymerase sigma factor SigM [Acidimicrobiales bacterium]
MMGPPGTTSAGGSLIAGSITAPRHMILGGREAFVALVKIDERDLVESHRAGDVDAFPAIVRANYGMLLARAMRRLNDRAAAEDAVQETFLRAFRALPGFGGDFRLAGWLHRILNNVCADETGRRMRDGATFDRLAVEHVPTADDVADATTGRAEVEHALALIPQSHREALLLREIEGMDYRELAAAAGISEENARARVSRARSAMRRLLSAPTAVLLFFGAALRRVRGQAPIQAPATAQAASVGTALPPDSIASVGAFSQLMASPAAVQLTSAAAAVGPAKSVLVSAVVTTVAAATFVAAPHIATDNPPSRDGTVTAVAGAADLPGSTAITAAAATTIATSTSTSTTALESGAAVPWSADSSTTSTTGGIGTALTASGPDTTAATAPTPPPAPCPALPAPTSDPQPVLVARAWWDGSHLVVQGSAWLEVGDAMIEGALTGRERAAGTGDTSFPAALVFTLAGNSASVVRLSGDVARTTDGDGITTSGWSSLGSVTARGCLAAFGDVPIALHLTEPGRTSDATTTTSTAN